MCAIPPDASGLLYLSLWLLVRQVAHPDWFYPKSGGRQTWQMQGPRSTNHLVDNQWIMW